MNISTLTNRIRDAKQNTTMRRLLEAGVFISVCFAFGMLMGWVLTLIHTALVAVFGTWVAAVLIVPFVVATCVFIDVFCSTLAPAPRVFVR